jgi:hypothetical protein
MRVSSLDGSGWYDNNIQYKRARKTVATRDSKEECTLGTDWL